MPNKSKKCTCEQRLDHSKVTDSRFRWLKTEQVYEKFRRRVCLKCGGMFSTAEVDKKLMHYYD